MKHHLLSKNSSFRTISTESEIIKSFSKTKVLRRLMSYSLKEKKLMILGQIFLLVSTLSQIGIPYLCGQFLDIMKNENASLTFMGIQFLILTIILVFSNFFRSYSYNLMAERVSLSLKKELFSKIVNFDIAFFDTRKTGELLSRLSSDIATIKWTATGNISALIRNILLCIGSFVLLFTLSASLALLLLLVVPTFGGFAALYSSRAKKYSKKYQDILADGSIISEEALSNIRTVKAFSSETLEIDHFSHQMDKAYETGWKKALLDSSFFSMAILIINGGVLMVLWYGGNLVMNGELSIGQLTSFIFYTLFMGSSGAAISTSIGQLVTTAGVCERIFETMDYKPKINSRGGVNYVENFKGIIQIKDVSFSYPTKSSVNVLSKFNITVDSGDSIAIVGTSGGGKSTIISLLMRFYDVSDGIIYFDGIDVKRYDLAFLHSKIGLVSQEPILFSGTIEENITYGIPIYNKEELDSISKLANAYDFINDKINFPQGYKTLVGERGVKLSGGQKQRIAIARSLMRKPKILIFDEATSALDAENEALVQQSIESIIKKGGITLIVIAHRLSTIVNCKRIVVLDQGNIVEDGNHEELMGKNGVYKNLVGKQILTK